MSSIAERLARDQKEISVSEFFEKNKQILGFDSSTKALIMSVKEAVDNSLDACEEASILPEIIIDLEEVEKDVYRITIEDNGPGIVPRMVPNVFGRLLYGSRFHSVRQSRGQQGIGISATVMYGQITTGKPATIRSKTEDREAAVEMDIMVNTKKNRPDKLREEFIIWDEKEHGTRIDFFMKGRYITGSQSIIEYLRQTAIVNPHAQIKFDDPRGNKFFFERSTDELPESPQKIKPHPEGVELGTMMNMAKSTEESTIYSFLTNEFTRISRRVAREILERAEVPKKAKPGGVNLAQFKRILKAVEEISIMSPPTDCLSPIGEDLIKKGLKQVLKEYNPEFYAPPATRDPEVYGGNPFLVEAGIVYGGDLPKDDQVTILRFANRVPLLYQQGAGVISKAVGDIDWRRYGLEQRGGTGIPYGPAILLVHVASTKVPFTSEAKEAIANIEDIRSEIELALRMGGRKLRTHLNKKKKRKKARKKFGIINEIIPQIAKKSASIVGKEVPSIDRTITKIMNVVWIEDSVSYDNGGHDVRIFIHNYTTKKQKFNLHAVVPNGGSLGDEISPRPKERKSNGKVTWELKDIPSAGKVEVSLDILGLDKDAIDENELYVSGINSSKVIGAEPLPGDWDIEETSEMKVEEEEIEEDEDEIDYDEVGEDLDDEQ